MKKILQIVLSLWVGSQAQADISGRWKTYNCSSDVNNCMDIAPSNVEIILNKDSSVTLIKDGTATNLLNLGNRDDIGKDVKWSYIYLDDNSIRYEDYETNSLNESNNNWIFGAKYGSKNSKLMLVFGEDINFPLEKKKQITLFLER